VSTILVIEDNQDLAFGLRTVLEFEGYAVDAAADGPSGLEQATDGAPDLVILDLMLPGMSGYDVLRELRKRGSRVPVLILTARGEERDVVMGFDSGADDYVTKPFSTLEVLARVRALLRRARGEPTTAEAITTSFGDVEVDTAARTVTRGGEDVVLTPKEFDLLAALLAREGAVVSRKELLTEVWRYRSAIATRTVDVHIAELRRKLERDPANPEFILTVRKAGYRLRS